MLMDQGIINELRAIRSLLETVQYTSPTVEGRQAMNRLTGVIEKLLERGSSGTDKAT